MTKNVFILLSIIFILTSCGENFIQNAPTGNSDYSSATINFKLPSGASLKPTGELTSDNRYFAGTVTGIALTVTGSGMDAINKPIPLDTKQIDIDVPSGTARVFTVIVTLDSGLSFPDQRQYI